MNVPFHYNVPSWIIKYISKEACSKCSSRIKKENIIAIGVRKSGNASTPYVEYSCPKCAHRAITSFGGHKRGSIQEICYILLDDLQNKNRLRKALETEGIRKKSKMSDKEVGDFLKRLHKSATYEDLLKEIGASGYIAKPKDEL